MQPNQQDPLNPTPPNSNIPEYLNMEPVADPSVIKMQRKKRFVRTILIALIVMLLVIAGGWLLWLQTWNAPQQKLYRALENSLKVSYLSRKYNVKNVSPSKEIVYTADSDLSRSSDPKTRLSYTDSRTNDQSVTTTVTGEKIILNQNEYFSIIKQVTPAAASAGLLLNEWNRAELSKSFQNNFDGIDSLAGLNSVQGIVVFGNFTEAQRKELMSIITSNNLYNVTANKTSKESGRDMITYTVALDVTKVNTLNKKALELVGSDQYVALTQSKKDKGELNITVDEKSEKIVKITYGIKKNTTVNFEKTINISYPSAFSIEKPAIVNSEAPING